MGTETGIEKENDRIEGRQGRKEGKRESERGVYRGDTHTHTWAAYLLIIIKCRKAHKDLQRAASSGRAWSGWTSTMQCSDNGNWSANFDSAAKALRY